MIARCGTSSLAVSQFSDNSSAPLLKPSDASVIRFDKRLTCNMVQFFVLFKNFDSKFLKFERSKGLKNVQQRLVSKN